MGLRERIGASAEVVADQPEPEPGDIEDAAAQDAGRFTAKQMLDLGRRRLLEVEDALGRLDDGSYGLCEESDEEIPFKRLELEPTTRYTVGVQAERERVSQPRERYADEPVGY